MNNSVLVLVVVLAGIGLWAALTLHIFGVLGAVRRWWTTRTVCWGCILPHRISGAPWARRIEFDNCPYAAARRRLKAEI